MTNAAVRTAHIQDTTNLYADIKKRHICRLFRSSSRAAWSTATRRLRSSICSRASPRRSSTQSRPIPTLWKDTAIFITFDEGGGYYDSGYVQPLDFFGDGTRIPLIVVSPYTKGGHISHEYYRSRLDPEIHRAQLEPGDRSPAAAATTSPIPITTPDNPYVPVNSPAIGDLFSLFNFSDNE